MMQAEHGFSSETYNFTEFFVKATPEGKILRRVWCGKFWAIFGWTEGVAYYGHSYDARREIYEDYHNRQISIPIEKVAPRWGL